MIPNKSFFAKTAIALAGLSISLLSSNAVYSKDFPDRPITLVVPFTPAGPTDSLARMLAKGMEQALNETVIVENKPGAAGNIGSSSVARAKPDGYTMLFASSGPLLINTSLFKEPGFDPKADFTPLAYMGEIPNVLVVNAKRKEDNLKDFINNIKSRDDISYGSSGNGSTNHLIVEQLKKDLNSDWLHIPYKGTAPALTDLIGNETTFMFVDVLTAATHIKSGQLKALGIASKERSNVVPDVPTFDEQGVPSLNRGVAFGVLAPAGISPEIKEILSDAAYKAISSEETQKFMNSQGVQAGNVKTADEFATYIDEQIELWANVVKVADIKPN